MSDRIAASPMEMVVRLDCAGVIDTAKFSEALLAEVERQPLLQANATVGKTYRQSYWRPAENCIPKILWCDGNPDEGRGYPQDFVPIDLENEIGFRFYGWQFSDNDQPRIVMKFVFHHASCDGKGGVGFAENTLYRYQCMMDEGTACLSELAAVDAEQILKRNLPAANKLRTIDRIWRALVIRPKRIGNMLMSKPRVFSENTGTSDNGGVYADPALQCSTELNEDETKQFGTLAAKLSATSNTILARELFQAVNDCFKFDPELGNHENTNSGSSTRNRKRRGLRFLIPFSLRDERHKQMPAANCVSMAYLEANEKILEADSLDDPVLVSELARQVKFIRRWQLQYSWIETIDLLGRIRPITKFFKFRNKDRSQNIAPDATAVMTNLGRVFKGSELLNSEGEVAVNSMVVKSVHVSPPCSATVVINFSISFYRNRLTLDVNYLPSLLTKETAKGILDAWKQRLIATAAGRPFADGKKA